MSQCNNDNCCKVETKMQVTASKKLAEEVKKELEVKDQAIASVLPKETNE